MDDLHVSTVELGFDDNGLENASQQEFWQGIVTVEKGPQLSQCDSIPLKTDEAESIDIQDDQNKPYFKHSLDVELEPRLGLEELYRTSIVINNEAIEEVIPSGQKQTKKWMDQKDEFEYKIVRTEGPEKVDDIESDMRSGEVETDEAKLRSGRSAKDGGFVKSNTEFEISGQPSLRRLCFSNWCATSFKKISLQLTVSFALGILVLMPSVGVQGAITTVPANTIFVVGQTARMNCSTDLNRPVFWARTIAGSTVQHFLYYGNNGFNGNNADDRFTIDKDEVTGRYDVIIEDVQPKDAGQYVCIDDSGIGVKASAELVISDLINCKSGIPSDGIMGYNVFGLEQDFIQMSCSLFYTGNLSPTLQWSWPGSEVNNVEPVVSLSTSSVTSTLKLSPTKQRDNVQFQCKANIEGETQGFIIGGLLWESETVYLRYAEFAPKELVVCPGIKWNLVCNPQCSYNFERTDNDCQCLYTYYDTRTQKKYEVTSDAVRCHDRDALFLVLVVVPVAFLLSMAAIIVVVICLKMKKAKQFHAVVLEKPAQNHNHGNSGNSSNSLLERI